jgi:hypothetical protein
MTQTMGFELGRAKPSAPQKQGVTRPSQKTFTHEQIVDMEIALELCNSLVAITNKQQDELEQSPNKDEARIAELKRLRMLFLHDWQSQITRDNMVWVRELIETYAPELKKYYTQGVLPKIISGV